MTDRNQDQTKKEKKKKNLEEIATTQCGKQK